VYIGGVIVDVVEVSAPGAPEAEGSEDEPPPGGGGVQTLVAWKVAGWKKAAVVGERLLRRSYRP